MTKPDIPITIDTALCIRLLNYYCITCMPRATSLIVFMIVKRGKRAFDAAQAAFSAGI